MNYKLNTGKVFKKNVENLFEINNEKL